MAVLRLPFWIVSERKRKAPPDQQPCDDPKAVLVFTDTTTLAEMLQAGKAGEWSITLVSDAHELMLAIADLHQKGVRHICLDANTDGSGGEYISLSEVLVFCRELCDDSGGHSH